MGTKILKKEFSEKNVLEATLDRVRYLYDKFDTIVVSFSGGKDSTACLNTALQVARERGKLPLKVYFFDEEVIHPETIDYIRRVGNSPEIELSWLCLPITHRNACSRHEPYWKPWNPEDKHKWVRELPEEAITQHKDFKDGMTMPEMAPFIYGPEHGRVADIRGLRASESIRRYQAVARRDYENWIGAPRLGYNYPCSPIYDWTTADVWTAPRLEGWDYNTAYDLFEMAGIPPNLQRVCPPYGEEPLGSLWSYHVCWPELWDKMIQRVDGAATAARYAKTELYGFGNFTKPEQMTWREFTFYQLDLYPPELRARLSSSVKRIMDKHSAKTNRVIHDTKPDPLSGVSWKFLANIVSRGDLKGRRAGQAEKYAIAERARSGQSIEDVTDGEAGTRY